LLIKMKNIFIQISIIFVIIGAMLFGLDAQSTAGSEVIDLVHQPQLRLEERIGSALRLALKKFDGREIWIAYSIDKSVVGDNYRLNSRQGASVMDRFQQSTISDSLNYNFTLMLDYSLESGYPYLHQVHVNEVPPIVSVEGRPIFWLGQQNAKESLDWLKKQFCSSSYPKLRNQLVRMISLHGCKTDVVEFHRAILLSQLPESTKLEAMNGLVRHESIASIRVLVSMLKNREEINLKKRAISVLSQMRDEGAHRVVYAIARKGKDAVLRKEAIFWLGQIATEKAIKVLQKIVLTESNLSLKEYAIFAIGQLPRGQGNEILCHIAETNPNLRMREKAKFWMGQTQRHHLLELLNDLSEDQPVK